ncbi:MAG: hypothetical protein Q4G08_03445 [Capnocytophaga sp.]|nr:hypothetical protein [Capnocytophaga sp.]
MKTQKLNLVELNTQELKKIDGGGWGALGSGLALYLMISVIEYPQDFVDGLLGR